MEKLRSMQKNLEDDEYEHQDTMDPMDVSLGKRLGKYVKGFSMKKSFLSLSSLDTLPHGRFYVTEHDQAYVVWWMFMVIVALYSSMFTPLEFGFFRGLPRNLWIVDLLVQIIFLVDIVVKFCTAYRDSETYQLESGHKSIAIRYIKKDFIFDLLGCLPWDTIYKGLGHKEEIRYLVWVRLWRVRKVDSFFVRLEKDIRVNYFMSRIVKLLAVEFYCTHTAACIYYYLATTVKTRKESYTWIGSLTLGSFSYTDFRQIDIGKRYVTSLYWAILTMATVGYGDIHAVNPREMVFCMIYVSFDMILGAYLLGNMTALIVKGSHTERFRDKMGSLIKYMNRNKLPRDLRNQMKSHVRLQFDSGTMADDDAVLEDLPVSIRAKIALTLYWEIVEKVSLFRGCSQEFREEIVRKVTEEYFLPGEVVIEQGGPSHQFYIVCHGVLEEIKIDADGKLETVGFLLEDSVFGEMGVLCDMAQPYKVKVVELCRVLRLDKSTFFDTCAVFPNDSQHLLNNLEESRATDARVGQLWQDIAFLRAKKAAEMALMVNNASFQGDLLQLKHLVKEGAVVIKADYDGRTSLHLAASKGFESLVLYLVREGADVNAIDKFGISPLLEAVRGGHDNCLSVLVDNGAELHLQDAGAYLCQAVKSENSDLMRRLLVAGVNVSSSDYDNRTALHLAAAEGSYGLAKMLIDAGADIYAQDRWGRTPLDEAMLHKQAPVTVLLKEAALHNHGAQAWHELHHIERAEKLSFPLKGHVESCKDKLEDQERSDARGQGNYVSYPSSPLSSNPGSLQGTPKRGRSGMMDHQTSSERHLDRRYSSGMGHPARNNAMDTEISSHQYRMMPIRQSGRPGLGEQPAQRTRRRLTMYPYHPWTPSKARTPGKVDWVPSSVEEVLNLASEHFGKAGTKVLNQDAGEISNTDLIMDSEKVYVVDENDILAGGSLE